MPRASQASGLAPPNILQPMRGSSIFQPPPQGMAPPPGSIAMAPSPNAYPTSRPQSRMEPPPLSSTVGPIPGTRERPLDPRKKRLIVTCDGTWMDSDNGILNGQKQAPSNVSRIGWAIKDTSRDGFSQVVHYQAGVGTQGGRLSRFFGGALGLGLKSNMREAYTFLAVNWHPGDEIFLIGFSRGAFTARSVGGMMGDLGLLTRQGLPFFSEIFEDYQHRHTPGYVSQFKDVPFPNKGPFDKMYVDELVRLGFTRMGVPIKAVCCWDTVGSLGIPKIGFLLKLGLQPREMHDYQFYDTRLNPYVENAFQALSLDERRGPFQPALWEKREGDTCNLKQVWFPGVHSNIGGGYDDEGMANITLAWMISRLEPFMDFRPDYLIREHESTRQYYKDTNQRPRPWSFGEIYNSLMGLYGLAGTKTRTPGDYYRMDPDTGLPTRKRLKNTNEYIHASTRSRLGMRGPGVKDVGDYDPPALRAWTYATEAGPPGQGGNADGGMVVWTNHDAEATGGQHRIPEAILLETELAMLRNTPKVEEYIRSMKEPVREKRSKRRGDGEVNGGPPVMAGGVEGGGEQRHHRRERAQSMGAGGEEGEKRRKRRSRRYS